MARKFSKKKALSREKKRLRSSALSGPAKYFMKKARVEKNAKSMQKSKTSPELKFEKLMKELKVKFKAQKIVHFKIFDYFLPDLNMLVEIHGDYWHGNPKIYENFSPMQKRNKKNDIYKKNLAKGLGYQYLEVWETELNKEYKSLKKRLKETLK